MMYSITEIIEQAEESEDSEDSVKNNVYSKIIQLWNGHKKKQILKSFDEVEPNVFVLKQEITDRIKLKVKKLRERKFKSKI